MATRYQYRVGVRSELFLDLILDNRNATTGELSRAVAEALRRVADTEGGIRRLDQLAEAIVYPDWSSVDPEVEAAHILDPAVVRTVDCVEINSIQ